jgi:hypothetical protein
MRLGPAWTAPRPPVFTQDDARQFLRLHVEAAAKARSEGRTDDARLHARAALRLLSPETLKLLFAEDAPR